LFCGGLAIGWGCIDFSTARRARAITRLEEAVLQGDVSELAATRAAESGQLTRDDLEEALRLSALYRREAHVRQLLCDGVDPNAGNENGRTALMMLAVCSDSIPMARMLIDAGANVNAADYSGRTALMYAADVGEDRMVEFLIDEGAQVQGIDAQGRSALSEAIDSGDDALIHRIERAEAQEISRPRAKNAVGGRIGNGIVRRRRPA
jgi:ankyrin repeat protein